MEGQRLPLLNCITQLDYGNTPGHRYISYDAIDLCMKRVAFMVLVNHWYAISMPKIGAGLGGGEWSIIFVHGETIHLQELRAWYFAGHHQLGVVRPVLLGDIWCMPVFSIVLRSIELL